MIKFNKAILLLIFALSVILPISFINIVNAVEISPTPNLDFAPQQNQQLPEINFFYSETCSHCAAEEKFFNDYLVPKYPDLVINYYNMADSKSGDILVDFAEQYGIDKKKIGLVPMTFIGESYILGFNTAETTGAAIELALIKDNPILLSEAEFCDENETQLCIVEDLINNNNQSAISAENYTIINQSSRLSAFGINAEDLSLPVLSIVLGFFDGFNICSLGALMLILSLVLTFKSRRKVLLFGGIFLAITGLTYALLIFIWFSLFQFLAPFVSLLEIIIGLLGLFGGLLFLRQYFRFKKYGPTCEMSDSKIINSAVAKMKKIFSEQKNIWLIALAIIIFSFLVTVIEFPCSAVIPVAFAAILTEAGVSFISYFFYLTLFMIFYLLDEIVIFLIGVVTLRLWMGGQKMTVKLTLIQAIVFLAIGVFYLWRLIF